MKNREPHFVEVIGRKPLHIESEGDMDREKLVETAGKLEKISKKSLEEWGEKKEKLVFELNQIMRNREDLFELIGEKNLAMMLDNHSNHARYIENILAWPDPENLVDTVLWVFTTYRSHGFRASYWPAQLNNWVTVIKTHLSEDGFREIYPIYEWMIVNQAGFTALTNDESRIARDPSGR